MENSSLKRPSSVPVLILDNSAASIPSEGSIPVEVSRRIGKQLLCQGRPKATSLLSVLAKTFKPQSPDSPRSSLAYEASGVSGVARVGKTSMAQVPPTTWPKIEGKPGCLHGTAARVASGLDSYTLQAAVTTANLLGCIIGIRSVAFGAEDAMKNGAVPKGLSVKGKSANYGPQNALIPRDPALSKIWSKTDKINDYRTQNEQAISDGKVNTVPLQLDKCALKTMIEKGLITLDLEALSGNLPTLDMSAVNNPENPANPDVQFRLRRSGLEEFGFLVEYRLKSQVNTEEHTEGNAQANWKPLEVLANSEGKPYTADFDLFTVMPKFDSPLLTEEMDNYRSSSSELEQMLTDLNTETTVESSVEDNRADDADSSVQYDDHARVFNFIGIEDFETANQTDAPSPVVSSTRESPIQASLSKTSLSDAPLSHAPLSRTSLSRASLSRSPLPLTPKSLYTPRNSVTKPSTPLNLNIRKLQLAMGTMVTMLGHSERRTPKPEVGKENYWEARVRTAFNSAYKSLTGVRVNPVKHGNEQNNPVPEVIEKVLFIKPNGEIWFAHTEAAAMAMVYMAKSDGHIGYLNKDYKKHQYALGVYLAESTSIPLPS